MNERHRSRVNRAVTTAMVVMASVVHAPAKADALDRRMNDTIAIEHAAGRFDGVVLVGRGDSVVYRHAIGWADRARHQAHRIDEPWRLASVSKQVAALLVMQQVERSALTLETPVGKLLPDFGSPAASLITVRQLLQHTSGLPNPDATQPADAPDDAMPPFYSARFDDASGPVNAALDFCAGPPIATPGERFSYNNCDTLVIQALLERLTSKPYARLLADSISTPLHVHSFGMADGTRETDTPIGYLANGRVEAPFNLATFGAAGALIGSADDLWRLDQALMQQRLLGAVATRVMWTGEPTLGHVALGAWSFPARLTGCETAVMLVERRGEIGGIQVRNLIAPERASALIVFSNTSATGFGEIWQGRGLMHEMASIAFCASR